MLGEVTIICYLLTIRAFSFDVFDHIYKFLAGYWRNFKRLMGAFWTNVFVGKLVVAPKVDEFAAAVGLSGVGPTDIHAHHHAAKIF